jgi:hypothetical protein
MLVLMFGGPDAEVERTHSPDYAVINCGSVFATAMPEDPGDWTPTDEGHFRAGEHDGYPIDDEFVLDWCDSARTARTAYMALLAVPTALLGMGGIAVRLRRPEPVAPQDMSGSTARSSAWPTSAPPRF